MQKESTVAQVTLPDGRTLQMRVPMRASEIAAIDGARDAGFVREIAVLYTVVRGAALDDASRDIIETLTPQEVAETLTLWSGATEDDALPPA